MSGSDSVRRRDECSTMYASNPDYFSNVGNAQQKQYNCYYLADCCKQLLMCLVQ